jgi:hypothetical protein
MFKGECLIVLDILGAKDDIFCRLTEISVARQLLEGKYRQYYHRDSRREREVTEIVFLAKSLYLTFEYTLQEIEAKDKLKDRGEHFSIHRFDGFNLREIRLSF